jgi:hypothetical protein
LGGCKLKVFKIVNIFDGNKKGRKRSLPAEVLVIHESSQNE